jgi:hypothetical protein
MSSPFRVEEQCKQETSMEEATSKQHYTQVGYDYEMEIITYRGAF